MRILSGPRGNNKLKRTKGLCVSCWTKGLLQGSVSASTTGQLACDLLNHDAHFRTKKGFQEARSLGKRCCVFIEQFPRGGCTISSESHPRDGQNARMKKTPSLDALPPTLYLNHTICAL
jgi:hypothetical protein